MPAFELTDISKRFGPTIALESVNLRAEAAEVHALIGENGAGKSTLMRILSGVLRPDRGRMQLHGQSYAPTNPDSGRRAGVSMIHQELTLAPHLSVAENIVLGREPSRFGLVSSSIRRRMVKRVLGQLGHDALPLEKPVASLPVAEQQIVEIARALVGNPRILILDEPTSSLTRADTLRLFSVLGRLRDSGVSIVYISHFLEECREVADRFTVLRDGRTVGDGSMKATSVREIIRLMVGRDVDDVYPGRTRTVGAPVFRAENLVGVPRPLGVSFELRKGEILGLAGLVGAGRTETARIVFGLDRLASGVVTVKGAPIAHPSPRRQIRSGIGFLSEDRKQEGLMAERSLADNLILPDFRPVARVGIVSAGRTRKVAHRWIDRLGIVVRDIDQPVGELSGGNQQKVLLARLLHQDAEILLLDEPTRGVDVGSKIEIYELIGQLADRGCAILFISSYLPELLGVCDRIGVMHRGRLAEIRETAAWDEHELIRVASGAVHGGPESSGD